MLTTNIRKTTPSTNRRRKGLAQTEQILLGALIVVVVIGIVLGLYTYLRPEPPPPPPQKPLLAFKCESCGYEFNIDFNDPAHIADRRASMDPRAPQNKDCPSCKRQGSAWPMSICPNCHEHYIPNKDIFVYRGPNASMVKDICPKCGTDRVEWLRQHRGQ